MKFLLIRQVFNNLQQYVSYCYSYFLNLNYAKYRFMETNQKKSIINVRRVG